MSSPAHSISSADKEAKELAKLKAKHEAELREAAERKARRDQERQERREREKREKKEREEREAREEVACRLREVGKAVAEVAWGLAETDQEQEEREKEALRRMRTAEYPTEAEVEAPAGTDEGGREGNEGPSCGDSETESGGESDPITVRLPRWGVVSSRQNTAEVVIIRPPKKGTGASEQTGVDQVSLAIFGRGSELTRT